MQDEQKTGKNGGRPGPGRGCSVTDGMDSKDARCMQDDENDFGEERDMSSNQKKSVIKKMTVS